ncbi:hypothetical protein GQ44DRAFT_671977 [Phaeosphaeriaceae sp. PMI808]|nr:hypothetical protein GQ44DRAFT_671977 [Phaeosphaeriaceae sp. PMI808]
MKHFEYQQIDLQGFSFDLVRLFQGSKGSLQCELFDAWMNDTDDLIEYDALSYTWGDTERPHEIQMNGMVLPVTENLSLVLRQLRLPQQDRIL